MTMNDLEKVDFLHYPDEGNEGIIVECSLSYSQKLRDETDLLPLCPRKRIISALELSPQQLEEYNMMMKRSHDPLREPRISIDVHNKSHVVLLHKHLRYLLEKGMKVVALHKAIIFNQEPWLKSFIDMAVNLRRKCRLENDSIGEELAKKSLVAIWGFANQFALQSIYPPPPLPIYLVFF